MNKNPKITALMPVYNGEEYLREAIESILSQSFEDFEFLIINDGSTDSSVKIIKSYSDPRIRLVSNQENVGIAGSLNKGIKFARGEYIARMDSDDISLPKRFERQAGFLDRNPNIGIAGSWMKTFGGRKRIILAHPCNPEMVRIFFLFDSPLAHPTVMMRSEFLKKNSLWYEAEFSRVEDYRLWTRASKYFSISNVPNVLLLHREHEKNISKVYFDTQREQGDLVRMNMLSQNLSIRPSEEELMLHNIIHRPPDYSMSEYLKKEEMWLSKLVDQNNKLKYYKEPYFSAFISLRWFWIFCANTSPRNFGIWKEFYLSNLRKLMSANERRFLIGYSSKYIKERILRNSFYYRQYF